MDGVELASWSLDCFKLGPTWVGWYLGCALVIRLSFKSVPIYVEHTAFDILTLRVKARILVTLNLETQVNHS